MQSLPLSCSGFDAGRAAEALLVAELAGGRTVLRLHGHVVAAAGPGRCGREQSPGENAEQRSCCETYRE